MKLSRWCISARSQKKTLQMAVIHQKKAKEVSRMAEWVGSRRLSLWWWRYLRERNPEPCVAGLHLKRLRATCQKPLSIGIELRRVTEKTVCRANTGTLQAPLLGQNLNPVLSCMSSVIWGNLYSSHTSISACIELQGWCETQLRTRN